MTVSASSAKDQVQTATTGFVDLRESPRWAGGSLVYGGGERLVTGWHFHDLHEIEYACTGMVEVRTGAGHYLLPPHQAAWIPAGLHHQTTLHAGAQTLAVLFEPAARERAPWHDRQLLAARPGEGRADEPPTEAPPF